MTDMTDMTDMTVSRPEHTAISRSAMSRPCRDALEHHGWIHAETRVLDYGCGRGSDVRALLARDIDATGYDPHAPFGHDQPPVGTFDLVMMLYVVNVLDDRQTRLDAVAGAWSHVGAGGALFLVSRSDTEITRDAVNKHWPPHRDGYWSNQTRGMFQRGHNEEDLRALIDPLSPASVQGVSRSGYRAILARMAP